MNGFSPTRLRQSLLLACLCVIVRILSAQQSGSSLQTPEVTTDTPAPAPEDPPVTMFPHGEWDRLWLSGQANFISQWHPAFHSPYQGKNSLSPEAQDASSRVLTLYTGLRVTKTTELLCDVQETGGHGLGEALGVAGFFNLDVVRNPTLSKAPYVARLMWHQIIPLGDKKIASDRTPYSLFRELPERRLEFRFGKMSLADFFDLNTYGTDTNLQFMNWAVDNNGAYDYAADTRGFTFAVLMEYHDKNYVIRFAEALMPKVANGIHLDADMSRARAENIEFELHGKVQKKPASRRTPSAELRQSRQHGRLSRCREFLAGESHHTRSRNHQPPAADHRQVWFRRQFRTAAQRLARPIRALGME